MITRISTTDELTHLLTEIFINRQDKVTKISDESVLAAMLYGVAKVGQKAEKDIAITESRLFPDRAFGVYLDEIAQRLGLEPRKGALGSSTELLIYAAPGTQYEKAVHSFKGDNGIEFIPTEDLTIGDLGFGYLKVRSSDSGLKTNIDPLVVNSVTPTPNGHEYVVNEYMATGGRDHESDDQLRKRIKSNPNITAQKTTEYLTQLFSLNNDNICKVFKQGFNRAGRLILSIVTNNGAQFSQTELDTILQDSSDYIAATDLSKFGSVYGIKLKNVDQFPIDVDLRLDLFNTANPDTVRKDIQLAFSKYVDFTTWNFDDKIEWDDLLQRVKDVEGVRYVPDQYFHPSVDLRVPRTMIPRFRRFIMRDLEGNIIVDTNNVLNPYYYG